MTMANVCESCRFGYIEPTDDGYYCEALDEVIKLRTVCRTWSCKLSKIGTKDEFEHVPVHAELEGGGYTWWYVCSECHTQIKRDAPVCSSCGRPVIWE